MCGIAGKVAFDNDTVVDLSVVYAMMEAIAHRGPDDQGVYVQSQAVLGHRRLSIIDLSTGKQPISNEDGTIWVVYNGEIYNFRELRSDLLRKGHVFRTKTDTEVIVHLYEDYGEECVRLLRGMFAFALWDAGKKKLLLARDRVGIKPLYYTKTRDSLLFASEIKALRADPDFAAEINIQSIDTFLTINYLPGRDTLLRHVYKLDPGHYLVMERGVMRITSYWDLQFSVAHGNHDFAHAVEELTILLESTVKDHMISDVPIGILLSGGVDSTALLSFMVQQSQQVVRSFTIGFCDEQFADERYYAQLAAKHFGTEHFEITITAQQFQEFLPKYVRHMEEPVCEPPAVALYYVTKLAKEHVKVLVSGEGGDEAFAGYQNYRSALFLEYIKSMGKSWQRGGARALKQVARLRRFARLRKFSPMMDVPLEHYYYGRTSGPDSFFRRSKHELYTDDFREGIDSNYASDCIGRYFKHVKGQDPLNQMLYVDTKTWLPDDLLIKADKMTMANSLELRVPLLDHKVLEFAATLPPSFKVHGCTTKYILKKVFDGRVPKEILQRKKTGFPVPLESWLRGELKTYTRDLLYDSKTLGRGYFKRQTIESLLEGSSICEDRFLSIFSLMTLELWHREFFEQCEPLSVESHL